MTITRYTINEEVCGAFKAKEGDFVKYGDHIKALESLEYDLRYVNEQLDITIEELKYYKELYFALCEQSY